MKNWENIEADENLILTKHFTPGRAGTINKIVLHHNAGNLTIQGWTNRSACLGQQHCMARWRRQCQRYIHRYRARRLPDESMEDLRCMSREWRASCRGAL